MNIAKDEDDFWYSNEKQSFSFENEVRIATVNSEFYGRQISENQIAGGSVKERHGKTVEWNS